jgi:hypothetical protein
MNTKVVSFHLPPAGQSSTAVDSRIRITLGGPDEHVELGVGENWGPVRCGRPHLVINAGTDTASFLVLQGFGDYDFVPESATS